jgi:lipid-binding SYLF domain-containing protein
MFAMEGGGPGFQIGGQTTGFVLLITNKASAKSLISTGVKLGKDVKVVAAHTDRTTDILFYSAQDPSGGVSLEGPTLRSDDEANKKLYGKELSAQEIVRDGKVKSPPTELVTLLQTTSPKYVGKAQTFQ